MAPTGQPASQAPQSMQVAASITYFPSPSEIAFTGHCAAHEPQLMHESFITCAIFGFLLDTCDVLILYNRVYELAKYNFSQRWHSSVLPDHLHLCREP